MHFCMDEVIAFMACVPFVGYAISWVRSRRAIWRLRHHKPLCVHNHGHEERL
jgi:hypothetical protein